MADRPLFSSGDIEPTWRVARAVDCSEAEARRWAAENGVSRLPRAYLWHASDYRAFLADQIRDLKASMKELDRA